MLERIKEILEAEAAAISSIRVGESFADAVSRLVACNGKLITCGIGKAGYIAQKAASTFSTTGTPSAFLHPGDASHGDVGIVRPGDILLALSNSGRTREILETVNFCRCLKIDAVIAVSCSKETPLGAESDIVIELGQIKEPCPLELTPTASAAAMLAVTDALALAAMEARGFTREDFAMRHHGGYLGEQSRLQKPTR